MDEGLAGAGKWRCRDVCPPGSGRAPQVAPPSVVCSSWVTSWQASLSHVPVTDLDQPASAVAMLSSAGARLPGSEGWRCQVSPPSWVVYSSKAGDPLSSTPSRVFEKRMGP